MKESKMTEHQLEAVKDIGRRIKKLRKEKKLSYPQLAKNIGMNKNSYYDLERGCNFTIRTLLTVLDYYQIGLSEFLCDDIQI